MGSYRCPKCKQSDTFKIEGSILVIWTVDANGDSVSYDPDPRGGEGWNDSSVCRCPSCGHQALFGAFRPEPEVQP